MNILVMMKTVKFVYAQTGTDVASNNIGPDDVVHIINPADELALEYALGLKDCRENVKVTAVSLGDRFAEAGLKRSLAMGADEGILIQYADVDKLDAHAVAATLAPACRQLDFSLICCGAMTLDDNTGLVGFYTAERLKIPVVSNAVKIEMDRGRNRMLVQRAVERGDRQVLACQLPALLTFNTGFVTPRYPTLAGFLRAEHQPVIRMTIEDLGMDANAPLSDMNLTFKEGLTNPKPPKMRPALKNGIPTAAERLKTIRQRGPSTARDKGEIVDGDAEKMFARLDAILQASGIAPK